MATSGASGAVAEAAARAVKIRRKITALKGHFTCTETRIMGFSSRASEHVVAAALAELNSKAEVILDLFGELIEVCPKSDVTAHEAALKVADDDMNRRQIDCQNFVLALPSSADIARRNTRSTAEAPRQQFKEQQGLRPERLLFNSSMSEFASWKVAYEAYFRASNMQLLEEKQQMAYLANHVDNEIRIRLRGVVSSTASLLQCYEALDKVFLE